MLKITTASLALLHDAGEALLGDLPHPAQALLPPGAKAAAELRAAEQLLAPLSSLAHARAAEALAGETREARFVALCDRLQLGVQLLAYVRAGQRGLEEFRRGLAGLDCGEFGVCEELRAQIQVSLDTD